MDDDGAAPLNITQGISLPLLVRDWVLKEYPDKCCYSLREFHDVELNLISHDQVNTVSSIVIAPNAKLTSEKDCAYLINVSMDKVEALYYYTIPMPEFGGKAFVDRSQYATLEFDWRDPSFFTELAKAIGCQCKKRSTPH